MFDYKNKKLIAFDVDNTLSIIRLPIDEEMTNILLQLLKT
jgi:hypothetical protein